MSRRRPLSARLIPLVYLPVVIVVVLVTQYGVADDSDRRLFVGGLLVSYGASFCLGVLGFIWWQCLWKDGRCTLRETLPIVGYALLLFLLPFGAIAFSTGQEMLAALEQGRAALIALGFAVGGLSALIMGGYALFTFTRIRRFVRDGESGRPLSTGSSPNKRNNPL